MGGMVAGGKFYLINMEPKLVTVDLEARTAVSEVITQQKAPLSLKSEAAEDEDTLL